LNARWILLVVALPWASPSATAASQATPRAGSVASDSSVSLPHLSDADEARARGLEGRLKCPVCRTQSVLESTSFMALEMRSKIRQLITAGRSDGEILDYFAERYGDYILLEPRKKGFALSAYVLPLLAVLVGGAAILAALARRSSRASPLPATDRAENGAGGSRGRNPAAVAEAAPLSPAERARIEEELERYTA
jgi:cytochrome c-type biogenesis protein CcmH